jgi:hypothetical protein
MVICRTEAIEREAGRRARRAVCSRVDAINHRRSTAEQENVSAGKPDGGGVVVSGDG